MTLSHDTPQNTIEIASDGVIVLPHLSTVPTHAPTNGDGYKRSDDYQQWRDDCCFYLDEAGMHDEAEKFDHCATVPHSTMRVWNDLPDTASTVWVCSDEMTHEVHLFYETCDCRFCPDCAHRQTARLVNRYVQPIVDAVKRDMKHYRLAHIVLTTPYGLEDDDAEERFEEFSKLINKLLDEVLADGWRDRQGVIAAIEWGTDGHKMHAHIIHYGQWIKKEKLTKAYKKLTGGDCEVNYMKQIKGDTETIANAVVEALKYSVKFWKCDDVTGMEFIDPRLIPKLAKILHRKRRIKTLGIFYGIGEVEREFCCAECGAAMARIGKEHYPIWKETGYLLDEWRILTTQPQAVIDLILANKSHRKTRVADKPPPELVQKDMFEHLDLSKKLHHYHTEENH